MGRRQFVLQRSTRKIIPDLHGLHVSTLQHKSPNGWPKPTAPFLHRLDYKQRMKAVSTFGKAHSAPSSVMTLLQPQSSKNKKSTKSIIQAHGCCFSASTVDKDSGS